MDTVLIAVAAISLALAIGMAIALAKLLRDDRARSEARVTALSAMAAEPGPAVEAMRPLRTAPVAASFAQTLPARPAAIPIGSAVMNRATQVDDLEIRPGQRTSTSSADLFAQHDQPSAWGPRLAVMGMLVVGLAVIGFTMKSGAARRAVVPAVASATSAPAAAENPPLELLSLRHSRQAQTLTVTGLVRNPRTGASLSSVVATAFVFAPDGTFLASSRASLDFATLTPGDESPFIVTVPVNGEVARYRVGFRTADGRVIAHVDKRGPDALASTSPK